MQSFKQIKALKISYAKRIFEDRIRSGQISLQETEHLPNEIVLTKEKAPAIEKKRSTEEEGFNVFQKNSH